MDILDKQPAEALTFGAEFSPLLRPGRVLASCATPVITVHRQNIDETATPDDITVSAPVLAPGGGTQAQVKVEGGVSGATYKFVFLAHDDGDDGGDVLKLDGLLRVRDR